MGNQQNMLMMEEMIAGGDLGSGENSAQSIPAMGPTPIKQESHMMIGVDFQSYLPSQMTGIIGVDQNLNQASSSS